jgi:hypothetical protein
LESTLPDTVIACQPDSVMKSAIALLPAFRA